MEPPKLAYSSSTYGGATLTVCGDFASAAGAACMPRKRAVADQDRIPSHFLRETLNQELLTYTMQTMRVGEPGGRRLKGTLYRIRLTRDSKVDGQPSTSEVEGTEYDETQDNENDK